MSKKYKIIAETAFSHEGDFNYLMNQIEEASQGDVDFIKFQVFINSNQSYVSEQTIKIVEKWMFSEEQWIKAFRYAQKLGIKVIALPLNLSSLQFCLNNEDLISMYEIHSVCFCEEHFIDELKVTQKDIVLGVGGRYPNEIDYVIKKLSNNKIILMLGFQSFPTDYNLIGLERIKTLQNLYNCEIGLADHTSFDDEYYHNLNDLAFSLGADYFEKHIVIKKGQKRIDFESAISSLDFLKMRKRLELTRKILGDGNLFYLNEKELKYRDREKQLVYSSNFEKGYKLLKNDLFYKITDKKSDYEQIDLNKLIGYTLKVDVVKNQNVKFNHIGEK